jgi:hypothetical protein
VGHTPDAALCLPETVYKNTISLLTPFAAYLLAEELPTYLWERLHDWFGFPANSTASRGC